jgi:hypothetical protein
MSNRARRRAATVSGALLLGAMTLAACGRGGQPQPVAVGAPAPGPAPTAAPAAGPVPLPTLPPVQQREPALFDGRGCARTGPNPADASCSSTASEIDQANAAPGPGQRLAGFVGGAWSTAAPTGTVAVLDGTVSSTATADGHWSATGLVRNQQAATIGGATVHADLLGADGSVLETVTGDALVHPVRPGEPAPFTLQSTTTTATQVASVRWSAEPGSASTDAGGRQVELQTYWTREPTDPKRVDTYLFHDPVAGPVPLVVYGAATDVGSAPVTQPHVVAAWSDASGHIVAVRDVAAASSTGDPAAQIAPNGFADFLFAVPPDALPAGTQLDTPMLWGLGS